MTRPTALATAPAASRAGSTGSAGSPGTVPRRVEVHDGTGWTAVCALDDLLPERGAAALLPDGRTQVALFRDRAGALYAVGNRDPFTGACVIARGITGSRGDTPTVASPLLKQVFDLRTGACLDEPTAPDGSPAELGAWPVRVVEAASEPDGGEQDAVAQDSLEEGAA